MAGTLIFPLGFFIVLTSAVLAYLFRKRLTRTQGKKLTQIAVPSALIAALATKISMDFAFNTLQSDALLVSPLFWLIIGWTLLSLCAIPFGLFGLMRPPDQ